MRTRLLVVVGVAIVIAAVIVFVTLGRPVHRRGKGQPRGHRRVKHPWGEPDLQGIWSYDFEVPLAATRPIRQPGILYRRGTGRARQGTGGASSTRTIDAMRAGSEQDVGGAYNAAIFTTHKPTGGAHRSSWIRRTERFLL